MISVIISSSDETLLEEAKQNVERTIGTSYQLLSFDNAGAKQGICAVYNQAIQQATYDILCFMHEDVAIHTQNWGNVVKDIFNKNPDIGVLGIAGSIYKSLTPGGWGNDSPTDTERSNLIQSFKFQKKETIHHTINPKGVRLADVVSVDGAWLCVRKEVFDHFLFDENTFKKFHCYDVDFCLSAGQKYRIAVTYDVLIHHFSEGRFEKEWVEEVLKLHQKWSESLPRYIGSFTPKLITYIERKNFRYFLRKMLEAGLSAGIGLKLIYRDNYLAKLGLKCFLKCHTYIVRDSFGKKQKYR